MALHVAAKNGNLKMTELLMKYKLECSVDINHQDTVTRNEEGELKGMGAMSFWVRAQDRNGAS